MRKIWFPAVLVAVLIAITIAYIRLVLVLSQNRPAFDALPETASIVFHFNNPKDALEKLSTSAFHQYLAGAPFFKKMVTQIAGIDSLLQSGNSDTTFKTWDNSSLLASMSITGLDEFDYLYVWKKENFSQKQFEQFMSAAKGKLTLGKRSFHGESIYEVNSGKQDKPLACTFVNGLLIASHSAKLVEEAVVQLRDKSSILENKGFSEVNELAGEDADVVAYLNFSNLALYEPLLVNEEQSSFFKSISQFGGWMELDLKVKNNSFIVNGYTSQGENKNFLASFKGEPTSQVEITHVIPYNTSLFFYHAVDDFRSYVEKRGETFSGELENFHNWIGNEWCWGLLEPLDKNYEDDVFLVARTIDPEIAAQSLAERARLTGDDLNLEEFKTFPIGQLSLKDELNNLFDHHFLKVTSPYYAVIDNYVVFANDLSVIKTVLENYNENQTLASDPDYMVFERNLTTTSNFYLYFNTSRSLELLNRLLSNALVSDIRKGNKDFVKFSPMALQFNHYQDIFFTNGYIQFSSQIEGSTNRLWQFKMDGMPIGHPVFVINHYTGEKEILMQDSLNNLYLLSKSGRMLWKKQLDGPIMGDVYLIDFYENTKLQYAFNTKGKIYILDRKGENVSSYPIKLPATATNGMLLVDYEKKKDYRMFVACSNGKVYGYYKSGKPLPGWDPLANVGNIKFPLKHVAVNGKDFIIAVNDAGEIYFFNRKGERREKPIKLGKTLGTDFSVRASKDNFQLWNADKESNIYKVYRNGSFSSQKQDAIPKNFFQFFYTDLNGDGSYELIFVDSLVTKIFNEQYQEIASPSFPDKIDKAFLLKESNMRGIGFISSSGKNIYFADADYKLYPGFPLAGCTPFITADLFETGRKVVITGDCEGWVNAYQVK